MFLEDSIHHKGSLHRVILVNVVSPTNISIELLALTYKQIIL